MDLDDIDGEYDPDSRAKITGDRKVSDRFSLDYGEEVASADYREKVFDVFDSL